MTIKELAYSAQQHIQVSTGNILKRTHIYELLAASFGFKSFAVFNTCALLVAMYQTTYSQALSKISPCQI